MPNRQCRKNHSRPVTTSTEYQTRWAFTGNCDHGNHHLARATIRPADPGLVTGAGLSALGLPDADAPIIDELAQVSAPNPITRILADAALLDLDRYATGRGLRYSRIGSTLILAVPSERRLADAIDTVAAAAINTGARVTNLTTQYIDDEKALASVGVDPWATRPSSETTGQADRILYVGRDGARIHVKAGRVLVDAPGSLPSASLPKNSVTRVVLSTNVGRSGGARSWAMRSGVDVVCLSRRGSYQGALVGANRGAHASRLLAQVALTGETMSGASAWPPASSARKSAAKYTSSPASPDATKPCTSPTRPRTCTLGGAPSRARVPSTKSWASKEHVPTPTSTRSPLACPPTSPSTGAADAHPATCPMPPCPTWP